MSLNSKNLLKGARITTFITQILEEIILHNMEPTSCRSVRSAPEVASLPGSPQGPESGAGDTAWGSGEVAWPQVPLYTGAERTSSQG